MNQHLSTFIQQHQIDMTVPALPVRTVRLAGVWRTMVYPAGSCAGLPVGAYYWSHRGQWVYRPDPAAASLQPDEAWIAENTPDAPRRVSAFDREADRLQAERNHGRAQGW